MINKKLVKLAVFVPKTHADLIRKTIGDAGGGKSGNYSHCTFSTPGIGRFMPLRGARPAIGREGKIEEVKEEKIEFICEKQIAKRVIGEIKKVHPYEEVALDIYPVISLDEL